MMPMTEPAKVRLQRGLRCARGIALGIALVLLWIGGAPPEARGAEESAESRAFKAATRAFADGNHERAESAFRRFVASYPQSPMLPEAILFQAQASMKLAHPAEGIALLSTHLGKAGSLADHYRYWIATAHLQGSNYAAAAESFVQITRQYTNSALLLEASHGEALARFKLRDYAAVTALLQSTDGAFQKAGRVRPNDELTTRGELLLAESLFELGRYDAAREVIARLEQADLTPEYRWDRQYLLCRVHMADRRLPSALAQTTNLIAYAATTTSRSLIADSVAMQADILKHMGRLDEAIEVYTNNLAEAVPADRRRMAFLNIIELKLAQDDPADAAQRLDAFLAQHPEDAASDVALLTAGELQLKLHFAGPSTRTNTTENPPSPVGAVVPPAESPTNRLQLAQALFDRLLVTQTNSPLRGKALLNKGWCLWIERQLPESSAAFRAAAELLPFSEDMAIARLKLADTLYQQGDPTNAYRIYQGLTNSFAGLPRVQQALFDQALYQMIRIQIDLGNPDAASGVVESLLEGYPESPLGERGLWLLGQDLIRVNRPAQARRILQDFIKRFPNRPVVPRVELAVARTYFQEGDWTAALPGYEEWISRHPTNELRPRAEFNLAWANARADRSTNALQMFTNFVTRFPTHDLAPMAQYWVAEELYRQQNYVEALRNFQVILENTNWPMSRLKYQARMRAGYSAFAARLWKDAAGEKGHFTFLMTDPDCPEDLGAQAWFAYADTKTKEQDFAEALKAFHRIPQLYPTNHLVPLAWGRIGDCCTQLASQNPKEYDSATNAYWKVITHPQASVSARSLAEWALAHVHELQAADKARTPAESNELLKIALNHYSNILYEDNLRANEAPDAASVERAGMAAAQLAEEQKRWPVAIKIYQRLQTVLPPLRSRLQDKINKAQEHLRDQS